MYIFIYIYIERESGMRTHIYLTHFASTKCLRRARHTHTHTRTHARTHTHTHTHTHAYTHLRVAFHVASIGLYLFSDH